MNPNLRWGNGQILGWQRLLSLVNAAEILPESCLAPGNLLIAEQSYRETVKVHGDGYLENQKHDRREGTDYGVQQWLSSSHLSAL